MSKRKALPRDTLIRAATVRSQSFDKASNTVEVVWTTGAAVQRYDWSTGGEYTEVLSLDPGAVRLDRLNQGAPFLNTHASYTLEDVIGSVVVDSARIEGGKGVATIQLSGAAADANTVQKIAEGVIRNVSVGYLVHGYTDTERDGVTTRTVTDWEPLELSAVPIPADAGAQIRSHGGRPGKRRADKTTPSPAPPRKVSARVADIKRWARKAGMPALGREHIRAGTSSDDFFRLLTDRLTGRTDSANAEDTMANKNQRNFDEGRRWAEKVLGRKSSRDDDDPDNKKDDDDRDEDDEVEVCPTCGKPIDDDQADDDDREDDDDDTAEKKDDDEDDGKRYLTSGRRVQRAPASGRSAPRHAPRSGRSTPAPHSAKITNADLERGRRHWEKVTGRKA